MAAIQHPANPFTRVAKTDLGGLLRVRRYRRCGFLLGGTQVFGSLRLWLRYLDRGRHGRDGRGRRALPARAIPEAVAELVIPFLKEHTGA